MKKTTFFAALSLIFTLFGLIFGQTDSETANVRSRPRKASLNLLPLSEVREGMRGIAKTVFRGTVPEDFNVEILGIVPGGIGPKQDMIVGKISGGGADRTSVFAGMSGSPVYIDGKLVGAVSYSFPFSKEAICGITPIEQMLKIFEKHTLKNTSAVHPVSLKELSGSEWKSDGSVNLTASVLADANANSSLNSLVGQTFAQIATPISFSGFAPATLSHFSNQLMSIGLTPVSSIGGAAKITPMQASSDSTLVGGTSVSMQLTRGDFSMAASGTVTLRDGNKIYAFGHPFLNLGVSDLPMSESHVVTVVPNLNNSFKLAVPDAMVGSMTQDRSTGVFGNLGQAPKMIPVKINLQTSRNNSETYNYEVARDDFLTPILLNITVYNSIVSNERAMGDLAVKISGDVRIKGQDSIKIERRFAGMSASQFAAGAVAMPINALLNAGFENTEIIGVELNLFSSDIIKTAVLERISLSKTEVKAGESFEAIAYFRTNSGTAIAQKIPVTIPAETPSGTLLISIGDGLSLQRASAANQFVPKTLAELIATINEVKKSDRLYVQAFRITNGAVIGASELPNLPPSVLATLNNDRTAGGFIPTVITALIDQEVAQNDYLITGQQVLSLEVVK